MWIQRDFLTFLSKQPIAGAMPVKVLKGPRQVGKTALLNRLPEYRLVLFDDLGVRTLANENPVLFFDQYKGPLILDEATLAPEVFSELKRRIDLQRREALSNKPFEPIDIWITGSNQTLLQRSVRESLAGRASYFDLNTLSLAESNADKASVDLNTSLLRGGWPELIARPEVDPVRYLNDLISTFIERDIVNAAGIEKKAAFSKTLKLAAGRIGQLINYSDLAKSVGADLTTVQSWITLLAQNSLIRVVEPYFNNLNQRLLKTPKIYFEDTGLATRLQGWTNLEPLLLSPYLGSLLENLALSEITRFFMNRGMTPEVHFVRTKEKVEVDFLIRLPNNRFVAAEVKATPTDFTDAQVKLLDSLDIQLMDRWVFTLNRSHDFARSRVVAFNEINKALESILASPA